MDTVKPTLPSRSNSPPHTEACMAAFRLFGDMPTLAIIYFLSESPKRFNELLKLTGMNPVTLTARLKKLLGQRIIRRVAQQTDKQSVTYSLDEVGQKTLPILRQIEKFSEALAE